MFNKKLVLRHSGRLNPYGLATERGISMTRAQTIEYFTKLNVTDEELISLNEFILSHPNCTIYDHPFCSYGPSPEIRYNYIEALRADEEFTYYLFPDDISFTCSYHNTSWDCEITSITNFTGYITCTISGKGSSFKTYLGHSDEWWICFPYINLSASLAHPKDLFWNHEELYRIFGNHFDAATIALAISLLYENDLVDL